MKDTGTTGMNAVDWEARVDMDRLRWDRLGRLKAQLERSDLGALLAFDFSNIRYMTSTHIGTWAMDKLIRFSLLTRQSDPISWDFGSAARHHALYNPWLDVTTAELDADPNAPHEGARRPRLERGAGETMPRESESLADRSLLRRFQTMGVRSGFRRGSRPKERLLRSRQPTLAPQSTGLSAVAFPIASAAKCAASGSTRGSRRPSSTSGS